MTQGLVDVPPKRLVLAGLPRSGTTLVSTVLAAQPLVHFATDYFHCFTVANARLHGDWSALLTLQERRLALAIVRDQFLRARHAVLVSPEDFSTLDQLHSRVMAEVAPQGCSVVGHKMLLPAVELEEALHNSSLHVLLMIRDPRDASLSYLQRTGEGVERYVDNWLATAELAKKYSTHPRLLTLRFEDLIQSPEATFKKLGDWLGVGVSHTIPDLKFRRGVSHGQVAWRENSAFGDVQQRFDSAPVGRHRSHPTEVVVRYAAWHTRKQRRHWGYTDHKEAAVTPLERLQYAALRGLAFSEQRLQRTLTDTAQWLRQHLPSLKP